MLIGVKMIILISFISQDPIDPIREKCEAKPEAQKYFEKLEECNSRVESKSKTEESCAEELYQYIHHVDHCVS